MVAATRKLLISPLSFIEKRRTDNECHTEALN
jgi:hypothetical protein